MQYAMRVWHIMSLEISRAKEYVNWIARKVVLNHLATNAQSRQVRRGEVYWCEFGLNIGSEMSKDSPRPAIIIQNNQGNSKSSNTIVVPVTHDSGSGPYLVPIQTQYNADGSILLDGKANTSNMICVSKARLLNYITKISSSDMKQIDKSIANMICLMPYYYDMKKSRDELRLKLLFAQEKLRQLSALLDSSDLDTYTVEKLRKIIDSQ